MAEHSAWHWLASATSGILATRLEMVNGQITLLKLKRGLCHEMNFFFFCVFLKANRYFLYEHENPWMIQQAFWREFWEEFLESVDVFMKARRILILNFLYTKLPKRSHIEKTRLIYWSFSHIHLVTDYLKCRTCVEFFVNCSFISWQFFGRYCLRILCGTLYKMSRMWLRCGT